MALGNTEDDGILLSLLSPASMSASDKPRRDGCDVLNTAAALLCDRGVGHSMGLLDPVETAAEEDDLVSDPCESRPRSEELRMDMVNAEVGVARRGAGAVDGGGSISGLAI
jgi:hypothetical protein